MWSTMVSPPGKGLLKNNQANDPSLAVTMLAASLAPVASVAKKLLAVNEDGSTGREKTIFGRKVVPTSEAPSVGVSEETINGIAEARFTLTSTVDSRPAASRAFSARV